MTEGESAGDAGSESPPRKRGSCLLVAVVVSGDGSQGLEDEVDGRVQLLLQPLQLQDAGVRWLAVKGQHLLQRVGHILGTADQSLETQGPAWRQMLKIRGV